jgi:hypothetical protein
MENEEDKKKWSPVYLPTKQKEIKKYSGEMPDP